MSSVTVHVLLLVKLGTALILRKVVPYLHWTCATLNSEIVLGFEWRF